jgi:hypothetical protein
VSSAGNTFSRLLIESFSHLNSHLRLEGFLEEIGINQQQRNRRREGMNHICRMDKAIALETVKSEGIQASAEALEHKSWEVRQAAAKRLGNFLPEAVQILGWALHDPCFAVADAAYDQFAKSFLINKDAKWSYEIATAFIYSLAYSHCPIKDRIMDSLPELGSAAIQALRDALSHPEWTIRAAAAKAFSLTKLDSAMAVAELTQASNDFVPQVANAARIALKPSNDKFYSSGSGHKAMPF